MRLISINGTNMKIRLFIILLGLSVSTVFAQETLLTGDFRFLGYKEDIPLFHLFGQEKGVNRNAYYTVSEQDGIYGFTRVFLDLDGASNTFFIQDEVKVIGVWESSLNKYKISIHVGDAVLNELNTDYSPRFAYSPDLSKLFLFIVDETGKENVLLVDCGGPSYQIEVLPIYGYRGYIYKDWLYFAFYHKNDDYSPYPDDIFRVKIGYWNEPELIFTSDEYDNWFLYPDSDIIATDIDLGDRDKNRENQIFYSTGKKGYAIVPNILTNRSSSPAYLKYNNKFYGFFRSRDEEKGVETIGMKLLPTLPDFYPNRLHEVLPREVWYNVPLSTKTFGNSFITAYLLREAPVNELERLGRDQLRLLRNALYAQSGYVFSSTDLATFFNQYEWYRMTTKGRDNNDDFVILAKDKARAELIRTVEDRIK